MSVKVLKVRGIPFRVTVRTTSSGARQINGQCLDKYCPHKCATCIMMPEGLWSVSPGQVAEKCFLHCKKLEKMAEEIKKRDGQISLVSLVKSEVN